MNWEAAEEALKKAKAINWRPKRMTALTKLAEELGLEIPEELPYSAFVRKIEVAVRKQCLKEKGIALDVKVVKFIGPTVRGIVSHISPLGMVSLEGRGGCFDPAKLRVEL